MRWELSAEQADFRSVLADWLADTCPADVLRGWLDAGDHATFEERFVVDGWFGVGSAEELGGEGGGLVELALTAEELGRRAAPASSWLGAMLAVPALAGAPEATRDLLTGGVATVLAVPAGTVPGTVAGIRTDDGGGWSGTVATVLGAARARRLVVPVAGRDEAVLVDVDQAGVRVAPRVLTDRTRSVADVTLDGARGVAVPLDADPFDTAAFDTAAFDTAALDTAALDAIALRAAVLVAADALGVLEQLLDATVTYVRQRTQFGVPIGSFQAVKHAAAEMLVAVESARSIVYLAAAAVEAGHPDAPRLAAAAKAQVCGPASVAADTALMLHGAIGYTWEHDLQIFYKRAKLDAELFGPPAAWNERLASGLDLLPAGGEG